MVRAGPTDTFSLFDEGSIHCILPANCPISLGYKSAWAPDDIGGTRQCRESVARWAFPFYEIAHVVLLGSAHAESVCVTYIGDADAVQSVVDIGE